MPNLEIFTNIYYFRNSVHHYIVLKRSWNGRNFRRLIANHHSEDTVLLTILSKKNENKKIRCSLRKNTMFFTTELKKASWIRCSIVMQLDKRIFCISLVLITKRIVYSFHNRKNIPYVHKLDRR